MRNEIEEQELKELQKEHSALIKKYEDIIRATLNSLRTKKKLLTKNCRLKYGIEIFTKKREFL